MKSENKISENDREMKPHTHSNDYNNEMSSGTIGAEGGNDNGASTLRVLHKKHANKSFVKSHRKPIL
jgi:hypothetical protein